MMHRIVPIHVLCNLAVYLLYTRVSGVNVFLLYVSGMITNVLHIVKLHLIETRIKECNKVSCFNTLLLQSMYWNQEFRVSVH